ncbi:MAG TPA: TetR/AcrR family transcriptional regulator [Zeimonas sp.]
MTTGSYHHGNLRQALVEAALERLEREGVEKITLRAIAAQVGVSHAAPYAHFRDKDALLAAVSAAGFGRLRQRLHASRDAADSGRAALARMGCAYVAFARSHPALYSLMFRRTPEGRGRHDELDQAAESAWRELHEVVAATVPRAEARSAAVAAWALVHGLASLLNERLVRLQPDDAAHRARDEAALGMRDDGAALVEEVMHQFARRYAGTRRR